LLYADASAIGRVFFADEEGHEELRALLFESGEQVVTSELAKVELAAAVRRAGRAARVADWSALLAAVDATCALSGAIMLLELRPRPTLDTARELVLEHRVRALDAIHLAVALEDARPLAAPEELRFVTRDRDQADAAAELGLTLG
jgi:predicted nucleic acid-binding protein